MATSSKAFRDTFKISREIIQWYPGHMKSSFTHMQAKMRVVDCIVEVHDSRVPFSGRNPAFLKTLVGTKPHILVLNKKDLINNEQCQIIKQKYREENMENVIFTNCLNQHCNGLKQVISLAIDLMKDTNRTFVDEVRYKMMVVGIPNVGKSSLINALRNSIIHKGKATSVGAKAGITRKVQNEVKICMKPSVYLIDTPGILVPRIADVETGMKLALCSCLNDDVVGILTIADFLLYWMNKTKNFSYVDYFGLKEPVDAILPILVKIAVEHNNFKKVKNVTNNTIEEVPNVHFAAEHMVKLYRTRKLGDLNLDCEYLES